MRNSFILELELENDRGAVETSFVFFIACFYNKIFIIPYRMNQMQAVAKRDNLYTVSLFVLKSWLFRLKYILKLRKHTFKNIDKFFGVVPGVGKCPVPGTR